MLPLPSLEEVTMLIACVCILRGSSEAKFPGAQFLGLIKPAEVQTIAEAPTSVEWSCLEDSFSFFPR